MYLNLVHRTRTLAQSATCWQILELNWPARPDNTGVSPGERMCSVWPPVNSRSCSSKWKRLVTTLKAVQSELYMMSWDGIRMKLCLPGLFSHVASSVGSWLVLMLVWRMIHTYKKEKKHGVLNFFPLTFLYIYLGYVCFIAKCFLCHVFCVHWYTIRSLNRVICFGAWPDSLALCRRFSCQKHS